MDAVIYNKLKEFKKFLDGIIMFNSMDDLVKERLQNKFKELFGDM